jgi:hypothetical protein
LSALRTALVLVLDDAQPALEPVRAEFHAEAVARGIPFHVTVLFPFVAPDVVPASELEQLFGSFPPLDFTLTRLAEFPGFVYAVPEPDRDLLVLMRAVYERFPETPPYEGELVEVVRTPRFRKARRSTPSSIVATGCCRSHAASTTSPCSWRRSRTAVRGPPVCAARRARGPALGFGP